MKQYLIAFVLLLASGLSAQTPVPSPTPTTYLACWDHDGINVDGFRMFSDGSQVFSGSPARRPDGSYCTPFPALTPGDHQLAVEAFNIAGPSKGRAVLNVRLVVIPSDAGNVRIEVVQQ